MPDNISAAAILLAFGARGALKSTKTMPLLSAAEAVEAMKHAFIARTSLLWCAPAWSDD